MTSQQPRFKVHDAELSYRAIRVEGAGRLIRREFPEAVRGLDVECLGCGQRWFASRSKNATDAPKRFWADEGFLRLRCPQCGVEGRLRNQDVPR